MRRWLAWSPAARLNAQSPLAICPMSRSLSHHRLPSAALEQAEASPRDFPPAHPRSPEQSVASLHHVELLQQHSMSDGAHQKSITDDEQPCSRPSGQPCGRILQLGNHRRPHLRHGNRHGLLLNHTGRDLVRMPATGAAELHRWGWIPLHAQWAIPRNSLKAGRSGTSDKTSLNRCGEQRPPSEF